MTLTVATEGDRAPSTPGGAWRLPRMPVYPLAFTLAFLVSELIEQWAPMALVIRPMLVLGGLALVLQLLLGRLVGRDRAALLATMVILLAFDIRIALIIDVLAIAAVAVEAIRSRRMARLEWSIVTRALNVIAVIALAVSIGQSLLLAASLPSGSAAIATRPQTGTSAPPDIYLILLDAYPRADTLQRVLGHDNGPFLAEMEALGFEAAAQSHSNYNRTLLTLASMLNGRHVADLLPGGLHETVAQNRELSTFIGRAAALEAIGRLGYEVVVIPTEFTSYTPRQGTTVLDSGQISQFEYFLPRDGLLNNVLVAEQKILLREQHRARVLASFESLRDQASTPASAPRLVFAHILLPHDPIAFAADGSVANAPECYWGSCEFVDPMRDGLRQAISDQVTYANLRTTEVVSDILANSDQPPVIVIFGDHGFRHWASDRPETFENLFMAFTPGHADLFPDNVTPVTVLPRLLNAYLGQAVPLVEDSTWVIGYEDRYFSLLPWDGVDGPIE